LAVAAGVVALGLNQFGIEIVGSIELLLGGWLVLLIAYAFGPGPALLSALIAYSGTWADWGHPWAIVLGGLEAVAIGYSTQRLKLGKLSAALLYWLLIGGPLAGVIFFWLQPLPFPSNWVTLFKFPLNSVVMVMFSLPIYYSPLVRRFVPASIESENDESLAQVLSTRFATIIGLTIAVLAVLIGHTRDRTLRQEAELDLAADAREIRRDLGEILRTHERALSVVAPAAGQEIDRAVLRERLDRTRAEYPGFLTMLGADREGIIIAASPERAADGRLIAESNLSISDRAYFRTALERGQPYVSEVFRGRGFGDDLIAAISVPVPGPDGKPAAVLAGSLNLRQILTNLVAAEPMTGRSLLIVDSNGKVVVSSGSLTRPILSQLDPALARPPSNGEVFTFDEVTDGHAETFLVAQATLRSTGWHIYLAEPVWTYQSLIALYYLATAIGAVLSILLALGLARTTAKELTAPLGDLVHAIESVARGESDTLPEPSPQFSRELTHLNLAAHRAATALSRANRELASALAQRDKTHQQLRQLLFNLDEKVRQRTEELEVALQQAESANRAKSEFIAATSHELRTPLNVILGMCEVLIEELIGPLTPRQRESILAVDESGRHLLQLINDILDLSKIEAGKLVLDLREFALRDICEASLRFVRSAAQKKNQTLTFDCRTDVTSLVADALRLKQSLVNLLANAVKFTPEGGCITLRVEPGADGAELHFSVIDTGIGIAPEDQPRLFQAFQQVDGSLNRRHSGTGLGLALVRRLIELHGGRVGLESQPGTGSTFIIKLPLVTSLPASATQLAPLPLPTLPTEPAPSSTPASRTASPAANGLRVLIAEDNDANALIVRRSPALDGAHISRARNGFEAVAQATAEPPDLILMDVQMPDMDGLEATRRLRADPRTKHVPIIVITALAMFEDRVRALEAGANAYLSKPFSIRDLGRTIEEALSAERKKP